MMNKPFQGGTSPILVELKEGESLWWCACGKSDTQPYCDGSHKGTTTITPLLFTAEKDGSAYLCTCKLTKNPPYCDGSHLSLEESEQI